MQEDFNSNHIIADALYESLRHFCWCIALSWIILACLLNYGGVMNKFLCNNIIYLSILNLFLKSRLSYLALPLWMPISKLSYCIYLLHLPLQLIYLGSIRTPQYFTNYRAILKFFGDFSMAFLFAFLWALAFEYPVLNLIAIHLQRSMHTYVCICCITVLSVSFQENPQYQCAEITLSPPKNTIALFQVSCKN